MERESFIECDGLSLDPSMQSLWHRRLSTQGASSVREMAESKSGAISAERQLNSGLASQGQRLWTNGDGKSLKRLSAASRAFCLSRSLVAFSAARAGGCQLAWRRALSSSAIRMISSQRAQIAL